MYVKYVSEKRIVKSENNFDTREFDVIVHTN